MSPKEAETSLNSILIRVFNGERVKLGLHKDEYKVGKGYAGSKFHDFVHWGKVNNCTVKYGKLESQHQYNLGKSQKYYDCYLWIDNRQQFHHLGFSDKMEDILLISFYALKEHRDEDKVVKIPDVFIKGTLDEMHALFGGSNIDMKRVKDSDGKDKFYYSKEYSQWLPYYKGTLNSEDHLTQLRKVQHNLLELRGNICLH